MRQTKNISQISSNICSTNDRDSVFRALICACVYAVYAYAPYACIFFIILFIECNTRIETNKWRTHTNAINLIRLFEMNTTHKWLCCYYVNNDNNNNHLSQVSYGSVAIDEFFLLISMRSVRFNSSSFRSGFLTGIFKLLLFEFLHSCNFGQLINWLLFRILIERSFFFRIFFPRYLEHLFEEL